MDFHLFGDIRAVHDEQEIALGSRRQKFLLALLLLDAGRILSLDRLTDLLWSQAPPARAVHTIRVYVSRLRQSLHVGDERPLLTTHAGGYRMEVDRAAVDVLWFQDLVADGRRLVREGDHAAAAERLRRALGLWTDEPLAEFPYEPYALAERTRLIELRRDADEAYAAALLELGDTHRAIFALRALVAEEALRERPWRLLALGLYRDGRQADALQACRDARAALIEVGLDASSELAGLESAILRQDPALALPPVRGLHNLPLPMDRFVGRRDELDMVTERLRRARLVTLVGSGGTGKTRLAVEVARRLIGDQQHGVWLVDLARASTAQVVGVTLDAVGAPPKTSRTVPASVAWYLRHRELLLVLDNCEHVIGEAATLTETVLERCPAVRILATSREPLRLRGESIHQVAPLRTPPATVDRAADLLTYDAAELLLERAGWLESRSVEAAELPALLEVLARLDGIPLAIELAAARLAELTPVELAGQLDHLLTAVGPGYRTAAPRHRTLAATLEWSYRLLDRGERAALRRLAVFTADFDQDAAAAVIGTADDAEALLAALVNRSMLLRTGRTTSRYRLLEPIRQYGWERCRDEAELDPALRRRDQHFAAVAARLGEGRRFEDREHQQRFLDDRVHLAEMIRHLVVVGRSAAAATAALDLEHYFSVLGYYDEASELLRAVLAPPDGLDGDLVRRLYLALGFTLSLRGDHLDALALVETAATAGADIDDVEWSNLRGIVQASRGELRDAMGHFERAIELARSVDLALLPPRLINLSAVAAWMGDLERSSACAAEAQQVAADQWDHDVTAFCDLLDGIRARMAGELDRADARLANAAEAFRMARSDFHLALALLERGLVTAQLGGAERARDLVAESLGVFPEPSRTPVYHRIRATLCLARIAWEEADAAATRRLIRDVVEHSMESGTPAGLVGAGELTAEMLLTSDDRAAEELLDTAQAVRVRTGLSRDAHEQKHYRGVLGTLGLDEGAPREPASTDGLADLLMAVTRGPFRARR